MGEKKSAWNEWLSERFATSKNLSRNYCCAEANSHQMHRKRYANTHKATRFTIKYGDVLAGDANVKQCHRQFI